MEDTRPSTSLRPEVVEHLYDVAMRAIEQHAAEATSDEVFSALFTLANQGLKGAIRMGADRAKLRGVVEQLMLTLADEGRVM